METKNVEAKEEQLLYREKLYICDHCGKAKVIETPYTYRYYFQDFCQNCNCYRFYYVPFIDNKYALLKDINLRTYGKEELLFDHTYQLFDEEKSEIQNISKFTLIRNNMRSFIYSKDILRLYKKHKNLSTEKLVDKINESSLVVQTTQSTLKLVVDVTQPLKKDKVKFFIDDVQARGWKKITYENFSMSDLIKGIDEKEKETFKSCCNYLSLKEYITGLIDNPHYEILLKAGIPVSFGYSRNCYNTSGKNPMEILKISKQSLKFYKSYIEGHSYNHDSVLGVLQSSPDMNIDKLKIVMDDLNEYHKTAKTNTNINIGNLDSMLAIRLYGFIEENGYEAKRLVKYITEDVREHQGIYNLRNAIDTLLDYVEISKTLELEYKKYPKDLLLEHSKITYLKLLKKDMYSNKMFLKAREENIKYDYSNKDYIMISPSGITDIKREGSDLCHCVGTYVDRYASMSSRIFFMRDAENKEKPLVTIELNQYFSLVQAKGMCNRATSEKEEKFIHEFLEHVLKVNNGEVA